jgi:hypothetical protein
MSTVRNGTTGASGTDPASGYNPMLSHLFIVFFLFLYRLNANISNPYAAIMLLIFTHSMICFMIFGIKICHKMSKTLTIQKLDCCDRLLVTSFAAALKSNAFDGSNYKRWHDTATIAAIFSQRVPQVGAQCRADTQRALP